MKPAWLNSPAMRLTLWYTTIVALLSILFSLIVFTLASHELRRPVRVEDTFVNETSIERQFERIRQERELSARDTLLANLLIFNLFVVTSGGVASYFLARRTLRPIEDMLAAQTRFSSDAAHELRTPLAIMRSEIEVGLRAQKPSLHMQKQLLESNLEEVLRLQALTDRLLALTHNQPVDVQPVQLDSAVTETINRTLPLARKKSITIEHSAVLPLTVQAEPQLLVDVLVVLVDNAIKYSRAHSEVKVSAKKQGRQVVIAVNDRGQGINATDLPHIFERFYRADQARSREKVSGHGLGLSIAKQLTDTMHGSLSAESKVDEGTTFTLRLPAA